MNHDLLSPRIYLFMKNGRNVVFKRFLRTGEEKPSVESCRGEITGITLAYAFCGEQDYGIRPLAKAFDALNEKAVMRKVPLEIVSREDYKAIKYGDDVDLNENLIRTTKQSGVVGYWDQANIIICAAPEYSFIIDAIAEFIKPNHTAFAFEEFFGGRGNLVIMSVK